MRRSVTFIAVLFCVAGLAACGSSSKASVGNPYPASTGAGSAAKPATATIETNMGTIVVALDTAKAPVAAGRFIELAEKGFYNGLTFHRVAPNFVIQGGDPKGNGTGGTGTTVAGEVPTDGYPIGSLAAAKTPNDPPGTFDCQFFIVTGNLGTQLPAEYARFGMVTSGLDVAQKIEKLSSGGDGPPSQKVVMTKVTISNT